MSRLMILLLILGLGYLAGLKEGERFDFFKAFVVVGVEVMVGRWMPCSCLNF